MVKFYVSSLLWYSNKKIIKLLRIWIFQWRNIIRAKLDYLMDMILIFNDSMYILLIIILNLETLIKRNPSPITQYKLIKNPYYLISLLWDVITKHFVTLHLVYLFIKKKPVGETLKLSYNLRMSITSSLQMR